MNPSASSPPLIYQRLSTPQIQEALLDTPVVLIGGPRQVGKTTLAKTFTDSRRQFLSLDDTATLDAARHDPMGFIQNFPYAVIDEIQRAPSLLLAIKHSVDLDRTPGRYLLTGSANLMLLPKAADSLAGRIEHVVLLPLSQLEMTPQAGDAAKWLGALFHGAIPKPLHAPRPIHAMDKQTPTSLVERVLCGGYPEAVARATPRRRQAWARQYLAMLLQRDVRDIAQLTKLDYVPKLLTALAHHAGQLCNFSQLAGQIGLDTKTAQSYTSVLEQIYLTRRLPVYSNNALSKLIKTPKIQFLDSGLLAQLLEINAISLIEHHQIFGHLLESFVYAELLKHISWSSDRYELSYYRDTAKNEIDFIIENAKGELLAIEVKATVGVSAKDFAGLKKLQEWLPEKFKTGIVLYNGVQTLPFGEGLWAIPISTLWQCQLSQL